MINAIELKAMAQKNNISNEIFSQLVSEFNEYSEKNNLDITLSLIFNGNENSIVNYNDLLKDILLKRSPKFDLFFYDPKYSAKFAEHLKDLYEYLPRDVVNNFDSDILSNTCVYNNQLIGLVNYSILFLLKKIY